MSLGCGAGHLGFALMSYASGSSFSSPFLGERSQQASSWVQSSARSLIWIGLCGFHELGTLM